MAVPNCLLLTAVLQWTRFFVCFPKADPETMNGMNIFISENAAKLSSKVTVRIYTRAIPTASPSLGDHQSLTSLPTWWARNCTLRFQYAFAVNLHLVIISDY